MFLEIHKTMCPLGYHHNGFIFLEIQNVNNAIVNKLNEAYNAGKLFILSTLKERSLLMAGGWLGGGRGVGWGGAELVVWQNQ